MRGHKDVMTSDQTTGAEDAIFDLPFAIHNGIGFAPSDRCTSILAQYDGGTAADQSRTLVFDRECIDDS